MPDYRGAIKTLVDHVDDENVLRRIFKLVDRLCWSLRTEERRERV